PGSCRRAREHGARQAAPVLQAAYGRNRRRRGDRAAAGITAGRLRGRDRRRHRTPAPARDGKRGPRRHRRNHLRERRDRAGRAAESGSRGGAMKPRRAALAALILVRRMALGAQAPKSQHAMVTQLVGTAQVTIVYNRPSARGRTLFGRGGVVPWSKVWCPGADTATTIALSTDMVVGGQPLAAGKYST